VKVDPKTIQVRREKALRQELGEDFGVKKAIQRIRELRGGKGYAYRRSLLSSALRLTRSMSPEIADTLNQCKEVIGYDAPIELYVTNEPVYNASCYREQGGPTVLTVSSRLLEAFTPAELKFVIGHELGHAALDHYSLPMPLVATLEEMGIPFVQRHISLKLYAWCRSAELSADRVGLICAQDAEAAASGFFKLASGMSSSKVKPDLATFAKQVESLATAPEARDKIRDDDTYLDCFTTHPYSPVRVRACWAFSRTAEYLKSLGKPTDGAMSLEDVEKIIDDDMGLMEPTYLQEKGDKSDILRRLLYTAGIAVAAAADGIQPTELEALGKLLGPDFNEAPKDAQKVIGDLDARIKDALSVPIISRAQLVQHLTIIASADGKVQDEEMVVMERVAAGLGVDNYVIHQTIRGALHPID
jgi:uncharacterized tellurite resistance protein B-like protein